MPETQATPAVPVVPEEDLLLALSGDEAAARRLHAKYSPLLHRAAARRNRRLPDDLHHEVVQEIWSLLYEIYSPRRAAVAQSTEGLFYSLLGRASDRVRSAYRMPRERARSRNERHAAGGVGQAVAKQVVLSLDKPEAVESAALTREDRSFMRFEARHDLGVLLHHAPVDIRAVFDVMLALDITMNAAAARSGVDRSRLQRWVGSVRQRAA